MTLVAITIHQLLDSSCFVQWWWLSWLIRKTTTTPSFSLQKEETPYLGYRTEVDDDDDVIYVEDGDNHADPVALFNRFSKKQKMWVVAHEVPADSAYTRQQVNKVKKDNKQMDSCAYRVL